MLGIADRSKILNLLNLFFKVIKKIDIEYLREMINEGIEPSKFFKRFFRNNIFYYSKKKFWEILILIYLYQILSKRNY